MSSINDMKLIIQEWMAQELTAKDLARTYAEIREELDRQMEYYMDNFVVKETE